VISVVERVLKQVRERRERETLARQLQATNQELQHRVHELTTIFAVGKAVTSVTDQRILFDKIVDGAIKVTQADAGWFLLRDETLKTFILAAQHNLPASLAPLVNRPWEDGISSLVAMSGESLSISGDPFKRFKISSLGQAAMIVPVKVQKQVMGILVVLRRSFKPFETSDKNLLEAVSDYASISLVNARLFRALDERAHALQSAVEKAGLNEKIKNDLIRAVLKTFDPPVTRAAEAVERILQGQAGGVTTDQARLLLTSQEQLLELAQILEATHSMQQLSTSAQTAPANLNELSRQAISAVQQMAQHNHVTLVGEFSASAVMAQADPAPILQCILGLLSNAIKFSPPGRQVILRVFMDRSLAHLTVKDSGAGIINPRLLARIFEPGLADLAPPSNAFNGLGIRLSLIKEVVTAQGGKVWAESQPGQGSIFHIALPSARQV
jgi:K+-sensing histidine kinase KdpD